jgi:hypothetical protein
MQSRPIFVAGIVLLSAAFTVSAQDSSSSAARKHLKKSPGTSSTTLDPGSVVGQIYRNRTLGLTYKIPEGWVLRTDEMNAHDDEAAANPQNQSATGQVLLAAFSRPPLARGEDVNSSVLIAAESAATYPGLKEAVQYFGPLDEVAQAQGFTADEEPYEIDIGNKTLIRADYHKDVASRVMRQSTLAMLSHGYAISITIIGGTDDEVEELVDGLSFSPSGK